MVCFAFEMLSELYEAEISYTDGPKPEIHTFAISHCSFSSRAADVIVLTAMLCNVGS